MKHFQNNRYLYLFTFLALLMVFCTVMSFAQSEIDDSALTTTSTTVGQSSTTTTKDVYTTTATNKQDEQPVVVVPKNITICIDAGHGWADNGASSFLTNENGVPYFEKDINLAISKYMRDKLESMGYTVIMIRESDDEISPAGIASDNICNIERRVNWVNNQSDIDLMISIHCNSFDNPAVKGTRIYCNTDTKGHEKIHILGKSIKEALTESEAAVTAPLVFNKSNELWSLTASRVPAILVECGFITNENDLDMLTNSYYQKLFAESLALATDEYFTLINAA